MSETPISKSNQELSRLLNELSQLRSASDPVENGTFLHAVNLLRGILLHHQEKTEAKLDAILRAVSE